MDPLEPVRRLQERLIEKTECLGLRLVGFAAIPGTPDHVQAVFEIDNDEAGKDSKEREIDREAEKFRAEMAAMERERKAEEALERLRKLAGGSGGFLPPAETKENQ